MAGCHPGIFSDRHLHWRVETWRSSQDIQLHLNGSSFLPSLYMGSRVLLSCKSKKLIGASCIGIVALTAIMQGILVFTRPTLTDDMYRYIWDGRVQAHGISPYRYPPNAPELPLCGTRTSIPHINRKPVVTVYPPAAEAAYALLWRILPDNVHWFQAVMACGGLLAGILLMGLLHDLESFTGACIDLFMVAFADL